MMRAVNRLFSTTAFSYKQPIFKAKPFQIRVNYAVDNPEILPKILSIIGWFKINNTISNYDNERSAWSILSPDPSLDSQRVRNFVELSVEM